MANHCLEDKLHNTILSLCAKGDALVAQRQFEKAFSFYREALNLVPNPVEEWEATTWILAVIGDLYFSAGNIEKSARSFEDAILCPGGLGNPFIHLRLGECYFEMGRFDHSADELVRAYMGAGREIFQKENPKYLQHLKTRIKLLHMSF